MKTYSLTVLICFLFACSGPNGRITENTTPTPVQENKTPPPSDNTKAKPTSTVTVDTSNKNPSTVKEPAPKRPLYYETLITPEQLEGRTLRELSLMRNWIYARAGNDFAIPWLFEFFSQYPWYKAEDKLKENVLTDIDRENAKRIYQQERKAPEELDYLEALVFARHGYLRPNDPKALQDKLRKLPGFQEVSGFTAKKLTPEDFIELSLIYGQRGIALSGSADYDSSIYNAKEDQWYDLSEIAMKGGTLDAVWYQSLDRLLTMEELKKKSQRELRLLRNTIYARHGRKFKSRFLQFYFQDMAWYNVDPGYTDARLSKTDRRNIKLIRSVEDSLGGPLSDLEHMKSESWFYDPDYGWGPGA